MTKPTTHRPPITHGACGATWTGTATAHCSGCCRTFSGITLFDRHRTLAGGCTDPAELRGRDGGPQCELREGVWRFLEMDAETKLRRFGTTGVLD